jgi:hypothetical protein
MRICRYPGCDRQLVAYSVPADQRPAGAYPDHGRGLCRGHHWRAQQDDTLLDYPRTTRSRDEILDDWIRCRSRGMNRRQAAAAMGMSFVAFVKAYERARAAGDPRARCAA